MVNLAILLLVPLILLNGVIEVNRNEEQDFIQKTAHFSTVYNTYM